MGESSPLIGRTLGHYRIVEQIGAGGMGVVYRARDERLDRDVALKVLPPGAIADEAARKRFRKEAHTLSRLSHPNVATIHDFNSQDGVDFLVMEYVTGTTLAEKVAAGAMPEKEVLAIGVQIARTLQDAHEQRIIHRDLKPSNVMLTPKGQVKLLDFGLATLLRPKDALLTESLADAGKAGGTLPYMAPEQLRSEPPDFRSDIYAAGTVLYEMATGRRPFDEKLSATLAHDILHKQPPPPGKVNLSLSPRLQDIILKCLEKALDNRYQTARELEVDLRRLERDSDPHVAVGAPAAAASDALARKSKAWTWAVAAVAAVVIIAGGSVVLWRIRAGEGGQAIHSIAVLPFTDANPDPDTEYLSDGITEGIINTLSQIPTIKVLAPTTVFRFKGHQEQPDKIGRDLKVQAVLTGKLARRGETLVVQTDLVKAEDGSELWGDQYTRKMSDVFAVQGEIAQEISSRLRLKLTADEQQRLGKHYTENPEAYQLYLKGRYYSGKATKESLAKGLAYFQQAIDKDPNYALAYSGLAIYYLTAVEWVMSPNEGNPKAKAAAEKALALDPNLAEAHCWLGVVLSTYDWDWPGAEREFRRSIELNPGYAPTHQFYGLFLASMGRANEAIAEGQRSVAQDPLSLDVNDFSGQSLYFVRRYADSIQQLKRTIEIDPNFWFSHFQIGFPYMKTGKSAEAIAEFRKAISLEENFADPWGGLGMAYGLTGKKKEAQEVLKELEKLSQRIYVPPYDVALVYIGLGDKDGALEWLEKDFQDRGDAMSWLKANPEMDSLRSDPRFQDLMRRVGLPP